MNTISLYQRNQAAYRELKDQETEALKETAQHVANSCNVLAGKYETLQECLVATFQMYQAEIGTTKESQAQQDTVFWAQASFWLSGFSSLIGAIGVVFVWASLKQTRQAITNDRDVGHAQVRAYVAATPKNMHRFGVGLNPEVDFEIVNTGQSPAYNVKHIALIMMAEFPFERSRHEIIIPAPGQDLPQHTLAASGTFVGTAVALEPLSKQDFKDAFDERSQRRLYVLGRVMYDDVFGKRHETRFAAFAIRDETVEEIKGRQGQRGVGLGWQFSKFHNDAN